MNKRILMLLSTIFLIFMFTAVQADDADTLLAQAEQQMQSNGFDKASSILVDIINNYPDFGPLWHVRVRLADCYYHENRYDDCIVEARKIVNLYPTAAPQVQAAWGQFLIGIACIEKKDTNAAIWELERVEQIIGKNSDRGPLIAAKNKLALIYHGLNNRKQAAKLAKEVLAESNVSEPDKAWAQVILGSSLAGDHETEQALAVLRGVQHDYPNLQEQLKAAERKIFDINIGRHDYDGTISECKGILANSNTSTDRAQQAANFLVSALIYKHDYDTAINEAQTLLSRFKDNIDECRQLLILSARACAMAKSYDKAIENLKAILNTQPTDQEINATIEWNLAICYRSTGQESLAGFEFQRLVELYPNSHLADRAADELQASK